MPDFLRKLVKMDSHRKSKRILTLGFVVILGLSATALFAPLETNSSSESDEAPTYSGAYQPYPSCPAGGNGVCKGGAL
jgi:hypothetical protein